MKSAASIRTGRPGFRFSQGELCISTEEHQMRLGTWPLLNAVRQHQNSTKWGRFVPVFRVLRPKTDQLPTDVGPEGLQGTSKNPVF